MKNDFDPRPDRRTRSGPAATHDRGLFARQFQGRFPVKQVDWGVVSRLFVTWMDHRHDLRLAHWGWLFEHV